jgi:hypothetical protein
MSGRGGGFGRLGTATGSTGRLRRAAAVAVAVGAGSAGRAGRGSCRRSVATRRCAGCWASSPLQGEDPTVLVAILATSLIGLINPLLLKLLIDVAIPEQNGCC